MIFFLKAVYHKSLEAHFNPSASAVILAWMPDKSAGSGFALIPRGAGQGRIALHESSHMDVNESEA